MWDGEEEGVGWGGNGEVRVSCTGMGRSGRDEDGRRVEEQDGEAGLCQ